MSGVRGMPLPDDELEPCGTLAAYRRHLRRGDPVDRDCRQAVVRDWQDRIADGWKRPSRRYQARTHLAGARGGTECRPAHPDRTAAAVTGDLGDVTCKRCLAARLRHLADAQAIERRRSRAAA